MNTVGVVPRPAFQTSECTSKSCFRVDECDPHLLRVGDVRLTCVCLVTVVSADRGFGRSSTISIDILHAKDFRQCGGSDHRSPKQSAHYLLLKHHSLSNLTHEETKQTRRSAGRPKSQVWLHSTRLPPCWKALLGTHASASSQAARVGAAGRSTFGFHSTSPDKPLLHKNLEKSNKRKS